MDDEHRAEQADEPSDGRFDAEVSAEEHEKRHADVERQPEGAVERVARCGEDDVEQDVVVYDEELGQNAEQFERTLARRKLLCYDRGCV